MSKSHRSVGQFNLRGKREMILSCRCCACVDLRETLEKRRIERELRERNED